MSKSKIALALSLAVTASAGIFAVMASSNAQQLRGSAQCGTFHDRVQVTGAPITMTTMFGVGREIMAAQDCVAQGDTSKACEHYRRISIAFGRLGPRFAAEKFPDVTAQMQQANCH
jgi:hypothetical protein